MRRSEPPEIHPLTPFARAGDAVADICAAWDAVEAGSRRRGLDAIRDRVLWLNEHRREWGTPLELPKSVADLRVPFAPDFIPA